MKQDSFEEKDMNKDSNDSVFMWIAWGILLISIIFVVFIQFNQEASMRLRPDKKRTRQIEAKERDAEWKALSPEAQLKELNRREMGATRQRARLMKTINVID